VPVECPQCHEREKLTKLRQPINFTIGQLVFGILGGAVGGLFWALGQENKYVCGQCWSIFFSHTRVSRAFWILAIVTYLSIGFLLLYGIFLSSSQ
jgi:DNA-directed RNA polymerase subunit RPC12/RpoP